MSRMAIIKHNGRRYSLLPPASRRKWFLLFRLDGQELSCHIKLYKLGSKNHWSMSVGRQPYWLCLGSRNSLGATNYRPRPAKPLSWYNEFISRKKAKREAN